jgi:putative transposase
MIKKKRRKYVRTTFSNHWLRKYPNLIKGLVPVQAGQIWVSDITYLSTTKGFIYLSLITDAYSHKIVGWQLSTSLSHEGSLRALEMALGSRTGTQQLIHHSDRGIQYCCSEYVSLLGDKGIEISMTENGDPLENAIAERVNGILKTEFGLDNVFSNFKIALLSTERAIKIYNTKRPHASVDYLTPHEADAKTGILPKLWKSYYQKANQVTETENNGFKRHGPNACDIKEMPALEDWHHAIGSDYSFPGCSPAEPEAASPDKSKSTKILECKAISGI